MLIKSGAAIVAMATLSSGMAWAGVAVVQPSGNGDGGILLLLVVGAIIVAAASGAKGKGKGPSE